MIEDFRLRTFITLARLASFTDAARELNVSQPAISQNLAELEKYVGAKLFERSSKKTILTEKGREFYEYAVRILDDYAQLDIKMRGPKSILLKGVLHDKRRCNILIDNGKFADIDAPEDTPADRVIEAGTLAILPALYNTHTHAAMTLLRGYADDMPLHQWLTEYVWPYEERLTPEDIWHGSEIATREMRRSGTCFFSDMYFNIDQTVRAVEQSGMRAALGITVMDAHSQSELDTKWDIVKNWQDPTGGLIQLTVAPHSVYTVGPERLKKAATLARRYGAKIHIHLSETRKEVDDCLRTYGKTPVHYLDSLGFLGPDVVAAHCVYIDEKEWNLLARRGVTVSHCPVSNMKLGSGRFPYELALNSGCRITLGTDGASSNNCLDLLNEMKTAALLAKMNGDPSLLRAEEVFRWATECGAQAFGINAGRIEVGREADAMLVDLSEARMQPCHNLLSNIVYAADSSVLRYTLCAGRVIYEK